MSTKHKCARCDRFVDVLTGVGGEYLVCIKCYNALDEQGLRRQRLEGISWWPRKVFEAEVAGDTEGVHADRVRSLKAAQARDASALVASKAPPVLPRRVEATQERTRLTKCHFCAERVTSLRDWIILDHPDRSLPTAFLSHLKCGLIYERVRSGNEDADLLGYGIPLSRIIERGSDSGPRAHMGDNLLGWLAHLRRKTWFRPSMQAVIEDGHAIANRTKLSETKTRRTISLRVRHELLERARGKCSLCGVHSSEATMHIDHIVPVSAGGTNAQENLRVLCADCNLGKGARPVLHLMASA